MDRQADSRVSGQTPGRRRFVAGAVCPSCAALDRLVVCQRDDDVLLECVSCGFQEIRTEADDAPPESPVTRLDHAPPSLAADDQATDAKAVMPVRILDP